MTVKRAAYIAGNATGIIPQPTDNTILKIVSNSYQWVEDATPFAEILTINTNGQTSFTLSNQPVDGYVDLFLNQLKVEYSEYSVSGSTVTYSGTYSIQTSDSLEASYLSASTSVSSIFDTHYAVSSIQSTTSSEFTRIGAVALNKNRIASTAAIKFKAILETSNIATTCNVQLYNRNTASYIGDILTSDSTSPEIQVATISYSSLSSGDVVYEVHMKTTNGSSTIYCLSAVVEIDVV